MREDRPQRSTQTDETVVLAAFDGQGDPALQFASRSVAGTYPSLTVDGTTIFFASEGEIVTSKRTGGPTEFAEATPVANVSQPDAEETAPWISFDRCRLYFFRDSTFMMAERKP